MKLQAKLSVCWLAEVDKVCFKTSAEMLRTNSVSLVL